VQEEEIKEGQEEEKKVEVEMDNYDNRIDSEQANVLEARR